METGMTENNESPTATGALAGLRVIDISENVAGQFCCRMLADYGADVMLVEPPGGSAIRAMPPFRTEAGASESLMFYHNNLGKSSVVLDRSTVAGQKAFEDLVKVSDVIVVPADTDRKALRALNANLIICTISGFGEGTPRSHWRGSEMIYQAMSGMMTNNGRADRRPLYGVGQRASYCAGIASYINILSAVMLRNDGGPAQDVAIDIAHAAAAMTYPFTLQYTYNGTFENRGKRNTPLLEVQCADVWVTIWIRANHFPILCELLEAPELLTDPRFLTDNLRQDNLRELVAEVQKRVAHRKGAEVVNMLAARRMVVACSYRPSILGPDAPHLAARHYWETVAGESGRLTLGPQFRMSATPRRPLEPAPALKQGKRPEDSNAR
jgi:crotonobetainyl-CoA:carnitine CoA-transferase CaiB-like acyl-CoA transferase